MMNSTCLRRQEGGILQTAILLDEPHEQLFECVYQLSMYAFCLLGFVCCAAFLIHYTWFGTKLVELLSRRRLNIPAEYKRMSI